MAGFFKIMKQLNNLPAGKAGGTIYQHGDPLAGAIRLVETLSAVPAKTKRFKFVPQAFFLGGIFGLSVIFSPLIFKEAEYRIASLKKEKVIIADIESQQGNFSELINQPGVKILRPVDPWFSLLIPKIGLNTKVLANVNATDKNQYSQALKTGVAHAAGTYLPGEKGRVFLFGHSTDYIWNIPRFNAVFYLLKELKKEDEIDIVYQGKRYIYQVSDRKIVDPSEVFYLKPKWGEEEIILQTCWPSGTTLKRLLIFAQPKVQSLAEN